MEIKMKRRIESDIIGLNKKLLLIGGNKMCTNNKNDKHDHQSNCSDHAHAGCCTDHEHEHEHVHSHPHSDDHGHGSDHHHESEHEHDHTHVHAHPHDHSQNEGHDHSHDHSHEEHSHSQCSHVHCGQCGPSDEKKDVEILTLLLDHWASHNKEHAMEYNVWVEKMNKMGKHDVAEEIIEAIGLMNEADKHLKQAKENI